MEQKSLKTLALEYHKNPKPGKIEIKLSKNLDLKLGYTPGVAEVCHQIHKEPESFYEYTWCNNSVGIISNGSAILGIGNLGAAASMPVMEGKCVLFKYFGNIDAFPIVINSYDVEEIIRTVSLLQYSFGGINLEDIKAPECFEIEEKLIEKLNIPVFHDDQHGTSIAILAFLKNSLKLVNKDLKDIKIVINGAGAAGISTAKLLKKMGSRSIFMCDTKGLIYKQRAEGMNKFKELFAVEIPELKNKFISLEEVMVDCDVFIGVSSKDVITEKALKSMSKNPIILALANPDPEITPDKAKSIRDDVIIATGRSDYKNQVNNVLVFPYIFRAALDLKVKIINDEMKIAAAEALADLVKDPSPDYLIPKYCPLDVDGVSKEKLLSSVSYAVAAAAIKTGVNRINLDLDKIYNSAR